MHVLHLVPLGQPARIAAAHPTNIGLISKSPMKIAHRVKQASGQFKVEWRVEQREAIVISISPQVFNRSEDGVSPWSFTFSNNPTTNSPGLYLPATNRHESFNVILRYARASNSISDTAELLVNVQTNDPAFNVSVYDPLMQSEIDFPLRREFSWGDHFLKQPQTIRIGNYRWLVGYPTDLDITEHPAFRHTLARRVASVTELGAMYEFWQSLERQLGRGTFGIVYLLRGMISGALRAAKCMEVHEGNQEAIEKFNAEDAKFALASQSSGPEIVRYYGVTVVPSDRRGYQVRRIHLQACHGSLRDLVGMGLAVVRFDVIVATICKALLHLHSAKVNLLHLDVKPENILFWIDAVGELGWEDDYKREALQDPFSDIKFCLTDFGGSMIDTGYCASSFGTLEYMAPEQNGYDRIDGAVDKFATGVMLLEVLHPPTVRVPAAELATHCDPETRIIRDRCYLLAYHDQLRHAPVPPHVQPSLWRFIQTLLAPNPANRPDLDVVANVLSHASVYSLDGSGMDNLVVTDTNGNKTINSLLHVGHIGEEFEMEKAFFEAPLPEVMTDPLADSFFPYATAEVPNAVVDAFQDLPQISLPELPSNAFDPMSNGDDRVGIFASDPSMAPGSAAEAMAIARTHIAYVHARRNDAYIPERVIVEEDTQSGPTNVQPHNTAVPTLVQRLVRGSQSEDGELHQQGQAPGDEGQDEGQRGEQDGGQDGEKDTEDEGRQGTGEGQGLDKGQDAGKEEEETREEPQPPQQGGKRPREALSSDSAAIEVVPRRRKAVAKAAVRRSERIKERNAA